MRFMVIVKGNRDSEAGVLPDQKILGEMGKYNEELVKAGVMLAGEGLQASSKGARVRFEGPSKRTVIDGPFTETKELVAGRLRFVLPTDIGATTIVDDVTETEIRSALKRVGFRT